MGSQAVQCNVGGCRHNRETNSCSLNNITVGNDVATPASEARSKKETLCNSFEAGTMA